MERHGATFPPRDLRTSTRSAGTKKSDCSQVLTSLKATNRQEARSYASTAAVGSALKHSSTLGSRTFGGGSRTAPTSSAGAQLLAARSSEIDTTAFGAGRNPVE